MRALIARPRRTRLADELSFHLEKQTRKHVEQGLSETQARTTARARFGPVPLAADECRDARGTAFIDNTLRDVIYAIRGFQRAPLFTLTVVTTVALGLGLVAIAFTVLNTFCFAWTGFPTSLR